MGRPGREGGDDGRGGGDGRLRRRPEKGPKPLPRLRRRRRGRRGLGMGVRRADGAGRGTGAGKRLLEKDTLRSPVDKSVRDGLLAEKLCKRHTEEAVNNRR